MKVLALPRSAARRLLWWLFPFAVVAVSLSGSACGSASQASPSVLTRESSPLDEWFGAFWQRSAVETTRLAAEFDQIMQNEIARCMHEAGFAYSPAIGSFTISTAHFEALAFPDDPSWVELNGFGILSGSTSFEGPVNRDWIDPNEAVLGQLSPTEREAWETALRGPFENRMQVGVTVLSHEEHFESLRGQGCVGSAQIVAQASSPLFLQGNSQFAPLFDSLGMLQIEIAGRQETIDLLNDWSECMSNAGFINFSSPNDARSSISERAWTTQSRFITDELWKASDAFSNLLRDEITLALADLECRGNVDYASRVGYIRDNLERQFIVDHLEVLEAFRAHLDQIASD
jgi:hypothetical protein